MPSSSRARVSSAVSGSSMSRPTSAGRLARGDALRPVDQLELLRLLLGHVLELLALDGELALVQLALRRHRQPLATRHGERPGEEADQPDQHHEAPVVGPARRAGDEAQVRDQAVVEAEDGRPQPTAGARPVAHLGAADLAALALAGHGGQRLGVQRLLVGHQGGGRGEASVALGVRGLLAQHDRQHRVGTEPSGQAREHAGAQRPPRRVEVVRPRCAPASAASAGRGAPRSGPGPGRSRGVRRSRRPPARGTGRRPRSRQPTGRSSAGAWSCSSCGPCRAEGTAPA